MSSGIFSALSGLAGLTRKLETTANNVANVNTPGFKSSRATLTGGGTQPVATAAGTANVGRGTTLGAVDPNFAQGTFESSENPTDLAIGGQGFFMLRAPGSATADHFTRAGGFSFDQMGNLVNGAGYFVQGWEVDGATGERQGSIGDINLGKTTPPVATGGVEMIVNLDARLPADESGLRLFDAWDGRQVVGVDPEPAIAVGNYDYTGVAKVYDAKGASQDVTVYFKRTGNPDQWEFLVTTDPLADQRVMDAEQQAANPPFERYSATDHKGAGALMYGVVDFNRSGQLRAITAYEVPPDGNVDPEAGANRQVLDPGDRYYRFALNTGGAEANQEIALNLGAAYSGQGDVFEPEAMASTQYATSSATIFQAQDGYAAGFLQSIRVDTAGVISGHYSNGQVLRRAQVGLANFANPAGLTMEGNGLYGATTESGVATTGAPGSAGLGTIAPNALEQSNVELATELPSLMLTKRYFQANLKVVAAEDEMLGNLLDIKK